MKKSFIIALTVLAIVFCSSCADQSTAKNQPDREAFDMSQTSFFDSEMTHQPTLEEVQSFCSGYYGKTTVLNGSEIVGLIPMREAVQALGKPHSFGPTSGITTLEWKIKDTDLRIVFTLETERSEYGEEDLWYDDYLHLYDLSMDYSCVFSSGIVTGARIEEDKADSVIRQISQKKTSYKEIVDQLGFPIGVYFLDLNHIAYDNVSWKIQPTQSSDQYLVLTIDSQDKDKTCTKASALLTDAYISSASIEVFEYKN